MHLDKAEQNLKLAGRHVKKAIEALLDNTPEQVPAKPTADPTVADWLEDGKKVLKNFFGEK